jgi:hypothetical protein
MDSDRAVRPAQRELVAAALLAHLQRKDVERREGPLRPRSSPRRDRDVDLLDRAAAEQQRAKVGEIAAGLLDMTSTSGESGVQAASRNAGGGLRSSHRQFRPSAGPKASPIFDDVRRARLIEKRLVKRYDVGAFPDLPGRGAGAARHTGNSDRSSSPRSPSLASLVLAAADVDRRNLDDVISDGSLYDSDSPAGGASGLRSIARSVARSAAPARRSAHATPAATPASKAHARSSRAAGVESGFAFSSPRRSAETDSPAKMPGSASRARAAALLPDPQHAGRQSPAVRVLQRLRGGDVAGSGGGAAEAARLLKANVPPSR